jgi:UDP-N-acetylmuramoyl-L-alanyl-D-glutamate--2,6-diaminopimelate ligase
MKLGDILKELDVLECTAPPETEIGGICYDSRAVRPGDLFVAVRGFASDGHRFISAAAAGGAVAVLCETAPENGVPFVRVADSRLALALASCSFFERPADRLHVIGVTGTNGKTTTTLLMKHVLERALGAKVGLIGTTGNWIGARELPTERTTPESYELQKLFREMLDAGCTHVVMEVSSHALALSRVAGFRFALGIFTNLTQDHLDFHRTMEEYAAAKAKLFAACDRAVLNYDDPWAARMASAAAGPVTTFSLEHNEADLVAKDVRLAPASVKFCAVAENEIARVSLPIPGRFSVYNALGVLAGAAALGIGLEAGAAALSTATGVRGRMEPVPTGGDYTVLIDYAHTPDALENVLKAMRETSNGRVVSVFGCGGDRDRTKRPILGRSGTELADFAIITSDTPRTEDPEAIIADILAGVTAEKSRWTAITDRRAAIRYAIENHRPGDVIVLCGKGHETYQEIQHVKHHMDEREIVAEILEQGGNV